MLTKEEKQKRKEERLIKQINHFFNFLHNNTFEEIKCHNYYYSIEITKLNGHQPEYDKHMREEPSDYQQQ